MTRERKSSPLRGPGCGVWLKDQRGVAWLHNRDRTEAMGTCHELQKYCLGNLKAKRVTCSLM